MKRFPYSLYGTDCSIILLLRTNKVEEESQKNAEGEIFSLFEQEFGRFLSPMECESITMWLDDDGHSVEIIRAALKEAVLAQKISLRYIDRILLNGKRKMSKLCLMLNVKRSRSGLSVFVQRNSNKRRLQSNVSLSIIGWKNEIRGRTC